MLVYLPKPSSRKGPREAACAACEQRHPDRRYFSNGAENLQLDMYLLEAGAHHHR
jgi:hypothetical protein